jgi:predicted transcriptional regulator
MKITLDVPTNLETRLTDIAARLNISVSELAEAAVRDLVAQPGEDFDEVASRVLEKNRELYRRLS